GITLGGNDCLDGYLADYLAKGTVPRARHGRDVADAVCPRTPEPEPPADGPAAKSVRPPDSGSRGAVLHRLLGTRT
ncbi:alpha/beta hydrolase, partial [Streptomyces sp. NPDC001274]